LLRAEDHVDYGRRLAKSRQPSARAVRDAELVPVIRQVHKDKSDWFNHRRLHGEIGLAPPAELETNHWAAITTGHYPETPVLTEVGSK
jgi:hypothetical protein